MNKAGTPILSCILLITLAYGASASACSTDAWLGGVAGVPSNATADSPPNVARYSELCALKVVDTSHVQSNYASDTRYRARFYVLDGLTGSGAVDIFEAYADEGAASPLFKVSFDGSEFTFDATSATGSAATAAAKNGWNVVEIDWDSNSNTFAFWVNADATLDAVTGTADAGVGTVEAVRLGAPNGFASQTGALTFDAFESHRTSAVGTLLGGDANNDGKVDPGDIGAVIKDYFNGGLATGTPDCNGDAKVDPGDIGCIITAYFSP